jgi:hypothetical protein
LRRWDWCSSTPGSGKFIRGRIAIGLALMLVTAFWGVLSQTYIQAARADQTQDVLALTNMMTKANVAGTLVFYASLVLILVAILADRESARSGGREP